MRRNYFLFIVVFALCINLYSQNAENKESDWYKIIHFEFSTVFPNSKLKESLPIRQNVSNTYDSYNNEAKVLERTVGYVYSAKAEWYNSEFRIGISSGLKFWQYKSVIKGKISENSDFFYFRYSSEQQEAKFARIKNITEKQHYATIPIEVRYYFINRKSFGLYTQVSANLGFNMNNKLDVLFHNKDMNTYEGEVLEIIKEPYKKFYTAASVSLGLRYYYINKVCLNFEFIFPSTYFGNNYFILTEVSNFTGIKASVQIPFSLFNK